MPGTPTTYSFKDLKGSFSHPLAGDYIFTGGGQGIAQLTISMATQVTEQDVSSDGAVMVSAVAGDNGTFAIECQQTSDLHQFLLAWYNLIRTAFLVGDVSEWATATLNFVCLVDGSTHTAMGVAPQKVADKVYTKQGQHVTWTLMAAEIINL